MCPAVAVLAVTALGPGSAAADSWHGLGHDSYDRSLFIGVPTASGSPGSAVVLDDSLFGYSLRNSTTYTRGEGVIPAPDDPYAEFFGTAFAHGDLDGDGHPELVVGVKDESPVVIWGSPQGAADEVLTIGVPNGYPAVGDFDGDGRQQLAVLGQDELTVYETFDGREAPAAERVIVDGARMPAHWGEWGEWTRSSPRGLIAADFTGDGRDELVAHGAYASGGDLPPMSWASYFSGGEDGIAFDRYLYEKQGCHEPEGCYVHSAAAGDVNGDGAADLVTAIGGIDRPGVDVYYGGSGGPADERERFGRTALGLPVDEVVGETARGDEGGWVVSVSDATGDGYADLALGIPARMPADFSLYAVGQAVFVPGSATGFDPSGTREIDLDTPGIPGTPDDQTWFGQDVQLIPADGLRPGWLAVSTRDGVVVLPVFRGGPVPRLARSFSAEDLHADDSDFHARDGYNLSS